LNSENLKENIGAHLGEEAKISHLSEDEEYVKHVGIQVSKKSYHLISQLDI